MYQPRKIRRSAHRLRALKYSTNSGPQALRATVALIGKGIKDGAKYIPLRTYAARLASRAKPKDYFGQVKNIYGDFIKNWRYVMDPHETELVTIGGAQILEQVIGKGAPRGEHGHGDCDDATIALGALCRSCGYEILVNTIERQHPPGTRQGLFSHVYPSVKIPGRGWLAMDAVGYPAHPLGWAPPYSRLAVWDLNGDLVAAKGQFPPAFDEMLQADISGIVGRHNSTKKGVSKMSLQGIDVQNQFPDYDLSRFGLAGTDETPPLDWSTHAALGFGAYTDRPLPIIDNSLLGLLMEYDDTDIVARDSMGAGLVRTKMLEMDPGELSYVYRHGQPRAGAVALSDDGEVYTWTHTPLGGFFKKLFSKVKSVAQKVKGGFKKGIKWVGSKAKALIKKLPGGKYLLRVYDRVKKIGMKLVRPLKRVLGKLAPLASKIAPLAALIPGWGVAISAALYRAGAMAKTLKKYGVKLDKAGRPKFKSGAQAKAVKNELERKAEKLKRKKKKKKKKKQLKRDIEKRLERQYAKREAELRRKLTRQHQKPSETTRGLWN